MAHRSPDKVLRDQVRKAEVDREFDSFRTLARDSSEGTARQLRRWNKTARHINHHGDGGVDGGGDASQHEGEWPAAEHAIFMCPWRERMRYGKHGMLGPWYGPATESAYERAMKAYQDTREAGSLWDEEEYLKQGASKAHRALIRKAQGMAERKDREEVRRYVQTHDVTPTERRVFYAYWEDETSMGRIAAKLLIPQPTVISLVKRLRQKANGGDAR